MNDIIDVQRGAKQQYFHCAGNYQLFFKVITSEHKFLVTKEFAALELDNKKIEYRLFLPIFKEVTVYRFCLTLINFYYSF